MSSPSRRSAKKVRAFIVSLFFHSCQQIFIEHLHTLDKGDGVVATIDKSVCPDKAYIPTRTDNPLHTVC